VNYWESPEAFLLFRPLETDEDAKETLQRRIERLKVVNEQEDGWRSVVDGRDPDNFCSKTDVFVIRQRSILLLLAYNIAVEKMNAWTWKSCCTEACKQLNALGIIQATSYKTLSHWNMAFRMLENFPHPNLRVQCGKHAMPKLFEKFPEMKDTIVSFAVKKLATLNVESVHDFVLSTLIPQFYAIWKAEEMSAWEYLEDDEFLTLDAFLRTHGLSTLRGATASTLTSKRLITKGWEGQPKGLLQVLWERGFKDPDKAKANWYTLDGRKDLITGEVDNNLSLRHLMGRCTDFRDEETALEHLARRLGVTVRLTPKFHAELAGEGVEYSWAHSKACYRRMPVSKKKGRENFKQLVKDCTCPVEHLTIERVRKFAARARAYICTYYCLAPRLADDDGSGMVAEKQQLLFTEIERLMKDFKVHRCALDFDRGFVNGELKQRSSIV
jgi:hypothetical protein